MGRLVNIFQLLCHWFDLTLLDGFLYVGIKTILSSWKAHSVNFRIRMMNAIYWLTQYLLKLFWRIWKLDWMNKNYKLYILIKKCKTQFVFTCDENSFVCSYTFNSIKCLILLRGLKTFAMYVLLSSLDFKPSEKKLYAL